MNQSMLPPEEIRTVRWISFMVNSTTKGFICYERSFLENMNLQSSDNSQLDNALLSDFHKDYLDKLIFEIVKEKYPNNIKNAYYVGPAVNMRSSLTFYQDDKKTMKALQYKTFVEGRINFRHKSSKWQSNPAPAECISRLFRIYDLEGVSNIEFTGYCDLSDERLRADLDSLIFL